MEPQERQNQQLGVKNPPQPGRAGASSANHTSYSPGPYFLPQRGERGVEVGGSQESVAVLK